MEGVEDFEDEDGVPYLLRLNFFSVDDVDDSLSLDSLLLTDVEDPYLLVYESFSLGSLVDEYLLVYVASFSIGSFAPTEAIDDVYARVYVAGVDVVVVLVDVAIAVPLVDDATTGVSRFALRYVPPEYDGLYDEGDVSVPKRGVALVESVMSSRDEYCNKTKRNLNQSELM